MADTSIPHSNTTKNDNKRDIAESAVFDAALTPPDFTTLGLPSVWRPAFEWAVKNNVVTELFLVANATCTQDMPIAIGTFHSFISSDDNYQLIQEWSLNEKAAMPLRPLSEAAVRDAHIFTEFPPLSTERAAARQFHGKLESHYLIALLTENLPSISQADRKWLNTLRLWVLTHAINRAFQDNFQDNWLRQVASKLRMACANDEDWRNLFLSLKLSTTDFDEISRGLMKGVELLLTSKKKAKLSPAARQLLSAIVKVSNREHAKDDRNSDARNPIPLPSTQYQGNLLPQQVTWSISEEENSDFANSQWIAADEEIAENVIQYDVDSEQSFTHQRLQGNSILLYCTEELQYLPYSWNKLNHIERDQIERWVKESSASDRPELRCLSSIVWSALYLGRSLRRTLDINIMQGIDKDWGLNPESMSFTRSPPRRVPGWKPESSAHLSWITPTADKQTLSIPTPIEVILKNRIEMCGTPQCIGDLWDANWSVTAEQLLRTELLTIAPRVTGSMFASDLPQRIFQSSRDQTFSRLISSHPQTALPGACAYSSWSTDQVSSALNGNVPDLPIEIGNSENAMGSLLDPIEALLKDSIERAANELEKIRSSKNPIAFHNAYSSYLSVALLAATGGRPIHDPFESKNHFDFKEQFVYVSDKASSGLRQARIVPLPNEMCCMIQEDYLSHLLCLARHVEGINPKLAADIQNLVTGSDSKSMPFLFLLSEDSQSWRSVSEREILSLGIFDWPLPLNHFRHRLSRQLRKNAVDPEVIDSILGHAETGTATHGDFSFRVWADDMKLARPATEAAFGSLGFIRIRGDIPDSMKIVSSASYESSNEGKTEFGAVARERKRQKRAKEVIADAQLQITQFLGVRTLSDLSDVEIDELSKQLLFSRNGMPHANGPLKYRVLLKCIEREWNNKGKKVKLPRRYQFIPEEITPFSPGAPGALALFQKIQDLRSSIQKINIGRTNRLDSVVIATVLLCIENNIADKTLLTDILHFRNFRIVIMKNIPYLEYSVELNTQENRESDIPTKRYQLSSKAASLLDHPWKKTQSAPTNIPDTLLPISVTLTEAGRMSSDINAQSLIIALADLVDQVNIINKPGILAGYLAGRVQSYSLLWRDWARLELKYSIHTKVVSDDTEASSNENIASLISTSAATTIPFGTPLISLQQNARTFLDEIRRLLHSQKLKSNNAISYADRTKLARNIQDILDKYDGKISTTIQFLVRWINSKLFKKIAGDLIRLSTILRVKQRPILSTSQRPIVSTFSAF